MYELTVGLETHCELSTATKIFCACSTQPGGEPNTRCCPVCTGQPGSLPVLNKKVIEYAVKAGLALGCEISPVSIMERKHYIYPDLAKGYQISQYEIPLCLNGRVTLSNGHVIRINRIHIEEDAGKLVHNWYETRIDYNRAGIPLIEIVTEPDFHSPDDVVEYLKLIQTTMRYLNVSRCRTEEGSIRCDVNISVAESGSEELGTRTEVKNLNSFTAVHSAIEYEYARQVEQLKRGHTVVQQTLGFDEAKGATFPQRDKEDADDYRYFPEPDIVPVCVSKESVEKLRSQLPELPQSRKKRFLSFGLSEDVADQLARHIHIADYFERAGALSSDYEHAAAMIVTQLFKLYKTDQEREDFTLEDDGTQFGKLLQLMAQGKVNSNVAKSTFRKMLTEKKSLDELLSQQESVDTSRLSEICKEALEHNAKAVKDYMGGKEKALQAIIGYVMRATRGAANVEEVRKQLQDQIKKM